MMKGLLLVALLSALPVLALAQLADVPEAPKADAKYLIYLHGVGIERYGVVKAREDYRGIVKVLQERGFIVISEVRSSDTKVDEYCKKVARQVKALITRGVPPENITVVGYSKGALIALRAAAAGDSPKVNYVILAGCVKKGSEFYEMWANNVAPHMKGRILSIYDAADPDRGTCQEFFASAGDKVTGKEIELETGQGHELFRNVLDKWMSPLSDWAGGK